MFGASSEPASVMEFGFNMESTKLFVVLIRQLISLVALFDTFRRRRLVTRRSCSAAIMLTLGKRVWTTALKHSATNHCQLTSYHQPPSSSHLLWLKINYKGRPMNTEGALLEQYHIAIVQPELKDACSSRSPVVDEERMVGISALCFLGDIQPT